MRLATFTALFAVLFGAEALAAPKPQPMSFLLNARSFSIGRVSDDGRMSEGERNLRALLSQSDAAQKLDQLLQSGSPEGQLYALIGLRVRDRARFDQVLAAFIKRNEVVHTLAGCLGAEEPMRVVAERIAHGDYDRDVQRAPY